MIRATTKNMRVYEKRPGFTLIEMLVAAALVVLMMTIFAEVFQMASGSMTLQRTISENDQQVRTITTIMRGDLQKRTFRTLVPFYPREDFNESDQFGIPFDARQGYFYVSSNDINNSVDNLLQFTVDASIRTESSDETPFYGRAAVLGPAGQFRFNPNQPESDDGQIEPNSTASSNAAEVSYFVRNGTLYRRVVLLRQPLETVGNSQSIGDVIQPRTSNGSRYFGPATSMDYWDNFDLAAYRSKQDDTPYFVGIAGNQNCLDNKTKDPAAPQQPLGKSRYRFGFDNSYSPTMSGPVWNTTSGLSREFFGTANELFLGRFTHEETSSIGFKYPCAGSTAVGGNPFATGATFTDSNLDGVVDGFAGGARVGQDILVTHVHAFEVELYDERIRDFVQVGHNYGSEDLNGNGRLDSGEDLNSDGILTFKIDRNIYPLAVPGDLHVSRNLPLNTSFFAPGSSAGHSFDTWHPYYDRDGASVSDNPVSPNYSNAMPQDNPPYRPMIYDPAGTPGVYDPYGVLAPNPMNSSSPYDAHWNPTASYKVGDVVFVPTEDVNYNGVLDGSEDTTSSTFKGYAHNNGTGDGLIDAIGNGSTIVRPVLPYGRVFYYVCRRAALNGAVSAGYQDQPAWGTSPNRLYGHASNSDLPQWEAVLNLRPVRAVRMTVRFLHRGSNKLRQMTLIHSLRDQ